MEDVMSLEHIKNGLRRVITENQGKNLNREDQIIINKMKELLNDISNRDDHFNLRESVYRSNANAISSAPSGACSCCGR